MKTLTVFTPTYNRLHTITRTYESLCRQTCRDFDWLIIDDGSSDGTREWVASLPALQASPPALPRREGAVNASRLINFDWMGRVIHVNDDDNVNDNDNNCNTCDHFFIQTPKFRIEYVYKPNGGLYTGYNVAYQTIQTELCVCIDSDDFMPDDAVEKIVETWNKQSEAAKKKYCGIIGLDFYSDKGTPIGGYFPKGMKETYRSDLFIKKIHCGDSKEVMRTELMRKVAPQIGFKGEKNFNPSYMLSQVWDKYPLSVLNENLCNVEYQIGGDSMSQGIYRQYVNSAKSYAKHRILHMKLQRYPYSLKFRSAAHYISSCILAHDKDWFKNTPMKFTTILAIPMGLAIYSLIRIKTWKH